MLDIYTEFKQLIAIFSQKKIEYALCGGLAMAVYGFARATIDIDVLIPPEHLEKSMTIAKKLGYTIEAIPMKFADGKIKIHRQSKIDDASDDLLMLDFLIVTPILRDVWESRISVEWEDQQLSVVSREGLIQLKSLRGSGQDMDDIQKLKEVDDES